MQGTRRAGIGESTSWVRDYLARTDSALADLRAVKRQTSTDFDTRIRALTRFRASITTSTPTCPPDQIITRLITAPLAGLR